MGEFGWLLVCVVIAFLIPSKYDPAIRLKEWTEKRNGSE